MYYLILMKLRYARDKYKRSIPATRLYEPNAYGCDEIFQEKDIAFVSLNYPIDTTLAQG